MVNEKKMIPKKDIHIYKEKGRIPIYFLIDKDGTVHFTHNMDFHHIFITSKKVKIDFFYDEQIVINIKELDGFVKFIKRKAVAMKL